jgi:hypothetical protein
MAYHVRVPNLVHDGDVLQLDVEELVYGFQRTLDADVVFELNGYFVVDQGLEEAVALEGDMVNISV